MPPRKSVMDDYKIQKFIDCGKFSLVYEVTDTTLSDDATQYALKRVFLQQPKVLKYIRRERAVLGVLNSAERRSPFLVYLHRCFRYKNSVVFIQTLASNVSLRKIIWKTGGIRGEESIRFYLCEIMSGLEFLHNLQIVHQDIKDSNVLLAYSGHVLISDMDSAFDQRKGGVMRPDFCSTRVFCPPEVANRENIVPKSDVWSLGITLVYMLFGLDCTIERYGVDGTLCVNASSWIEETNWNEVAPEVKQIVVACLQSKLEDRCDISGLKQLAFFSDVSWCDVENLKLKPPFPVEPRVASATYNTLVLEAAHGDYMPKLSKRNKFIVKEEPFTGIERLEVEKPVDFEDYPKEQLEEALRNIEFPSKKSTYSTF